MPERFVALQTLLTGWLTAYWVPDLAPTQTASLLQRIGVPKHTILIPGLDVEPVESALGRRDLNDVDRHLLESADIYYPTHRLAPSVWAYKIGDEPVGVELRLLLTKQAAQTRRVHTD
jgi:hypothetical protein